MHGARKAPAPRDSLNFRWSSLLSRNEFESGTFTIVLHATSSFTYISVIYGANFPFNFHLVNKWTATLLWTIPSTSSCLFHFGHLDWKCQRSSSSTEREKEAACWVVMESVYTECLRQFQSSRKLTVGRKYCSDAEYHRLEKNYCDITEQCKYKQKKMRFVFLSRSASSFLVSHIMSRPKAVATWSLSRV